MYREEDPSTATDTEGELHAQTRENAQPWTQEPAHLITHMDRVDTEHRYTHIMDAEMHTIVRILSNHTQKWRHTNLCKSTHKT